ncbi:MAG: hypothetical protein KDB03_12095 [Planctomycetales bacterium]|nr:hypothetical protein [Planctomycetales bacterium]
MKMKLNYKRCVFGIGVVVAFVLFRPTQGQDSAASGFPRLPAPSDPIALPRGQDEFPGRSSNDFAIPATSPRQAQGQLESEPSLDAATFSGASRFSNAVSPFDSSSGSVQGNDPFARETVLRHRMEAVVNWRSVAEPIPADELAQASKLHMIIQEMSASNDDLKRAELADELRTELTAAFDRDLAQREAEFAKVESLVKKLRATLERRKESKEDIIEHRVKSVLLEAEGLSFSPLGLQSTSTSANNFPSADSGRFQNLPSLDANPTAEQIRQALDGRGGTRTMGDLPQDRSRPNNEN